MKYLKIVILVIFWGLIGCKGQTGEEKTAVSIAKELTSERLGIINYIKLDTSESSYELNHNYIDKINEALKLDSALNTDTDLVIRLFSYQDFDTTAVYDMQMQRGEWTGTIYKLNYLTGKLLSRENFIPSKGWDEFERRIVKNDILNTGVQTISLSSSCSFTHPRSFTFQVITPTSIRFIDYGAFYNYLLSCKVEEPGFEKMERIMFGLLEEKNNNW
ncbi:hypothetical protein MKJ04_15030 [Pontibacter sp. E15-1]|uniref:hypothetical protein n=1 Tax=Pontibacter sp. E15-1 TaxID=2919918 RepID=UPI001F500030|nr:hypothetical protein [Pontibacter sp. E15-1]MCJ8166159.1 hypothetical protein [Pontibacter sp. E15-1]